VTDLRVVWSPDFTDALTDALSKHPVVVGKLLDVEEASDSDGALADVIEIATRRKR
jgi:hypothetical protein